MFSRFKVTKEQAHDFGFSSHLTYDFHKDVSSSFDESCRRHRTMVIRTIDSQIIRVPSTPIVVEHPGLGTFAKKGPLDRMTRSREHREKTRLKPYGPDGNCTKTHANKTINTLHQLERDHAKTSRILGSRHRRSTNYWGEVRKACWPVKTFHRKLFYVLPV